MAQGREADAIRLWQQVVAFSPDRLRAWSVLGQCLFRQQMFADALAAFSCAAQLDGANPRQWTSVAFAAGRLGDDAKEEAALFQALTADPHDLLALLMRGRLFQRQGRAREASAAYGAAIAVAPPLDQLPLDMRQAVEDARGYRQQHETALTEHLERFLAPHFDQHGLSNLGRFRFSLDVMAGVKKRFESSPLLYWFPQLAYAEFFDRGRFDWIASVESQTDAIRQDYLALEPESDSFVPYIRYRDDQPLDQWKELNQSRKWSAFHLIKDGVPVQENALRCPSTMGALAGVPAPRQAGRTPVAMFSVLQPHTRIPPHVGASNARLVAHLPLIVPPGCGFRVGNSVRAWVPGEVLVFDDSIEHEAWNDSDAPRIVLIFDVWHPDLSMAEREMVSALSDGLKAFHEQAGKR